MYVKDGVTYASGDEYADMLCARGEAEMYAQSDAIAGYELALAQAEAMIERQADEIARLRDEIAKLKMTIRNQMSCSMGIQRYNIDYVLNRLHEAGLIDYNSPAVLAIFPANDAAMQKGG